MKGMDTSMKKHVIRLLALCLALALWGCAAAPAVPSTPPEESAAESSAESTLSEISEEPSFVLSEKVALIDSFMTEEIDRGQKANNVFMDLPYTVNRPTDEKYPDNHCSRLTDCDQMDVVYGSNTYAGWTGSGPVQILFDLTGRNIAIHDLSIGCARIADYDINLPSMVAVQASNDGETFTDVGKIYTPRDLDATCKYTFYFSFPKALEAKYIRIVLTPAGGYLLADEILAYEYSPYGVFDIVPGEKPDYRNPVTDFYKYDLNLGDSEVSADPSDADYDEYQNLAALPGVDFQIQHFDALPKGHTNSGRDKLHLLNDGVLHGNESTYFVFYRGTGRHVTADLGAVMSVSECTVSFWDKPSWGVATPPVFYISLSENGTDWVTVYAEHNPDYGKVARINDTRECLFADAYLARYVRITFPTVPDNTISSAVYMGEFRIDGTKNPAGAVPAAEQKDNPYGKYPKPEDFGFGDILWAGVGNDVGEVCENYHVITEETAYHYLTTVDQNGKADKPLFDAFCFTSRGSLSWYADRDEGYPWYVSEVFREGVNMDALDAAQGRINKEKGTSAKIAAFVSVNCPVIGDTFRGKSVQTAQDYIDCLKWMADSVIEEFNAKDYQNVYLAGFYWQVENLRPNHWSPGKAHDVEAAIAFNEYVHELGYLSLWLPYYSYLNGIWHSHYYGFDLTCWQPNYMFNPTEPGRLSTIAELAKLYGVGIEIEIEPNRQSKESVELYREYLGAGYEYGFMNAVNAYYQGAVPGTYVIYREDKTPYNQAIYKDSVAYIQGTMAKDPRINAPADLSAFTDQALTTQHGKKVEVNLGKLPNCTVQFAATPIYGLVRLDKSGKLTYLPMMGYKGEDEIKITFRNQNGESKTITVKITVTE